MLAMLLFTTATVKAANSTPSRPEDVVHRYLKEVLEDRNLSVIEEIIQPDCVFHRPETELKGITAIRAFFDWSRQNWSEIHADVKDIIVSGDRVVVRLYHWAVGAGSFQSRLGAFDMKGKKVVWDSIAIFRVKEGKIAEEWVSRDELGILLSIGAVQKK
jgi:predicted ester cyclase